MSFHCFADHMEMYLSIESNNSVIADIVKLYWYWTWMDINFLHLNEIKKEIIMFGFVDQQRNHGASLAPWSHLPSVR